VSVQLTEIEINVISSVSDLYTHCSSMFTLFDLIAHLYIIIFILKV